MAENTIYDYPFWGPRNSGPAENFADPSAAIRGPQVAGILADSLRLRVPQETVANNNYLDVWQYLPVIMGAPQAPVTVPDQFARADSLYAYAMMTLGGEQTERGDAFLGNAGRRNF